MKPKEILGYCPECHGTGARPLPEHLAETIRLFARGQKRIASEVHKALKLDVTVSAMNARLEDLRKAGLLKRERKGKTWVYSRTETTIKPCVPKGGTVATDAAEKIMDALSKRKGIDLYQYDADSINEIREEIAEVVRDAIRKAAEAAT